MLVHPLGEHERVRRRQEARQGSHFLGIRVRAGPHPLKGSPWRVVATNPSRAPTLFALELHRGLKEILEEPEIRVEQGQGRQGLWWVIALPPHQLADMGPILLLNMRIVVLFVWPGARELDGVAAGALTTRHQMGIDERTPIVGVESSQRKRQAPFDQGQCLEKAVRAFAPHGLTLHPRGVNIHTVQGVQKLAAGGSPGM